MKKIILGSLLAASLLYAQGEKSADIVEDRIAEVSKQTAQAPKKENMKALMQKAKSLLLSKNPKALVYSATASVDVAPDDPQYYDYLAMAYKEAVLQLKADMILAKAGKIAIEESLKFHHKQMPDDMLNDKLKKEVDEKIRAIEADQALADGLFNLVGQILGKTEQQSKRKIDAEAKENIFSKAYQDGFTKEGFDSISGLIPYETFIIADENGEVQIGVLAYTTPKSLELARHLAQGIKSPATKNKEQCKSAAQIVNDMTDEELLSHLGIKYFYNENCRPALLAYGMDSFIKEDGMNADYEAESTERAKGMADGFIASFLNSNVNAFLQDTKIKSKVKDAMIEASKENGKTSYKTKKTKNISMVKEMSKDFSSNAQMQLRGLETSRDWSIDKGDYVVVGVMRYYSMDSIEEANRRFEPENYKNEEKKKNTTYKGGMKHTKNLDVDDF